MWIDPDSLNKYNRKGKQLMFQRLTISVMTEKYGYATGENTSFFSSFLKSSWKRQLTVVVSIPSGRYPLNCSIAFFDNGTNLKSPLYSKGSIKQVLHEAELCSHIHVVING